MEIIYFLVYFPKHIRCFTQSNHRFSKTVFKCSFYYSLKHAASVTAEARCRIM